jgi:hypothetical protein
VLIEGTFLHRDELLGYWDHSIYLDVALEVACGRMAVRDGLTTDAHVHSYTGTSGLNGSTSTARNHGSGPEWSSTTPICFVQSSSSRAMPPPRVKAPL